MGDDDLDQRWVPPGLGEWMGFVFFKAGWVLQARVESALELLGLRGRHYAVMTMLAAESDISQQQMSLAMSLDPTTMVSLIDDLEKWGLAERQRNPQDRRRYVIALTRKGRGVYSRAAAAVEAAEDQFFSSLTTAQREQLGATVNLLMRPHWGQTPQIS